MFNLNREKYISNVKNTLVEKYGFLRTISVDQWEEIMNDYRSVFFILLEDSEIHDIIHGHVENKRNLLKMKVKGNHTKRFFSEIDILKELSERLRGEDNE